MKYWFIWLLVSALVFGDAVLPGSGRPACIVVHDTNNVEICVSNFGKFGQTENMGPGCFWPKGSGHSYIFGAGIWFGTIDSLTGDTLVTVGYGPQGGETEFVPGLKNLPPTHPHTIIYQHPDNWPAPRTTFPMAPKLNISHQDSWCAFDDCDSNAHIPGDTRPIGIEVYQTVYVWDLPLIDDIVFFTYEIKNVSSHNLYNCYFGIVADNDIGNEAGPGANDQLGIILGKWYIINGESIWVDNLAYQFQESTEPGNPPWGPGVIGYDLLQTDFDLVPGMDKDSDGILDQFERDSSYYVNNLPPAKWDVDNDNVPDWRDASENPQVGLTAFKIFTVNLEPSRDNERYLTLAGYNFKTGEYCPFDTMPPDPDDQRFLMGSGPFNIKSDSSIVIVFALMLANWMDIYQAPDTAIVLVDKWAQLYYDMNYYRYTAVSESRSELSVGFELMVLPNPIIKYGRVRFDLHTSDRIRINLYNTLGQKVSTITDNVFSPGRHEIIFDTRDLSAGTYFIMLECSNGRMAQSVIIK